jgi:hypothetical protein
MKLGFICPKMRITVIEHLLSVWGSAPTPRNLCHKHEVSGKKRQNAKLFPTARFTKSK